ncbi:MAG: hypothetical protein KGI27_11990 [Thaumarchaeota archaeon]|nr:hypothetical protein [Nitrososphaerota archaeon]
MASLEALAKSYRVKKAEVAKLRRRSENNLKKTLSLKRRSSSGLVSIERKKESLARQISHVAQMLNQHHAQKESIARLKIAAEERLKREQDMQDSTRQQIDYGASEEKSAAQERLRFIDEKIAELHAGMKEREAAEARLGKQIVDLEKEKARLDAQLRKQAHAKPGLVEQLKLSEKAESILRPRVQSLIKREAFAAKTLQSMEQKLAKILAQRRNAKGKIAKKKTAKTRTKAKRAARKAKRKAPKKKTTKRRTAKRKSRSKSRR